MMTRRLGGSLMMDYKYTIEQVMAQPPKFYWPELNSEYTMGDSFQPIEVVDSDNHLWESFGETHGTASFTEEPLGNPSFDPFFPTGSSFRIPAAGDPLHAVSRSGNMCMDALSLGALQDTPQYGGGPPTGDLAPSHLMAEVINTENAASLVTSLETRSPLSLSSVPVRPATSSKRSRQSPNKPRKTAKIMRNKTRRAYRNQLNNSFNKLKNRVPNITKRDNKVIIFSKIDEHISILGKYKALVEQNYPVPKALYSPPTSWI
ncbi:hypothetical protein F5884DRAFT_132273 [Xylogone sp. PMI_703]|nr:hypothetical protein F5884DRAFT_132273 [Xylogone sp. PMI_703]